MTRSPAYPTGTPCGRVTCGSRPRGCDQDANLRSARGRWWPSTGSSSPGAPSSSAPTTPTRRRTPHPHVRHQGRDAARGPARRGGVGGAGDGQGAGRSGEYCARRRRRRGIGVVKFSRLTGLKEPGEKLRNEPNSAHAAHTGLSTPTALRSVEWQGSQKPTAPVLTRRSASRPPRGRRATSS